MKKRKNKTKLPRDWVAVDAHFRNSAGTMKDRREERGGARNTNRNFVDEYYGEVLEYSGDDISDNNFSSFVDDDCGGID